MSAQRNPKRLETYLARMAEEEKGDANPWFHAENIRAIFMGNVDAVRQRITFLRDVTRLFEDSLPEETKQILEIADAALHGLSEMSRLHDELRAVYHQALAEAQAARSPRVAGGRKLKRAKAHAAWLKAAEARWQRVPAASAAEIGRWIVETLKPNAAVETVTKVIAKVRPSGPGRVKKHSASS